MKSGGWGEQKVAKFAFVFMGQAPCWKGFFSCTFHREQLWQGVVIRGCSLRKERLYTLGFGETQPKVGKNVDAL